MLGPLSKARLIRASLVLLGVSVAASASVIVTPTVTSNGGLFEYQYSISNTTADDAFLIDIPVMVGQSGIQSLTAPAGFKATFDSGLDLISFLEDSSVFSSTPESGFSFESSVGPGQVTFSATLLSSTMNSLYTITGATLGPGSSAVPEPAHLTMFAASALAFLLVVKRLRRSSAVAKFL